MKRTIPIAAFIIFVFVFTGFVLGEEKISVIEYQRCIRWSPDGNAIAFTAIFEKQNIQKKEQSPPRTYDEALEQSFARKVWTMGIGMSKPDGSDLRIIVSYPWIGFRNELDMLEGIYRLIDKEFGSRKIPEQPVYPGGYKLPPPPPKPITPLFTFLTVFEWSADGRKIIFADVPSSYSGKEDMYIWVVNDDGTNLRHIFKTDADSIPRCLQKLEDGSIAFAMKKTPQKRTKEELFREREQLVKAMRSGIAVAAEDDFFLCLNPENGRTERRISTAGLLGGTASYLPSPNGKMVLQVKEDKGYPNIFVAKVGDREAINITNAVGAECGMANWSSDSKRIAFAFEASGAAREKLNLPVSAIWIINADGTNSRPLSIYNTEKREADGPGFMWDIYPTWSPDGRKIAFIRKISKSRDEYEYSIKIANVGE